MSDQRISHINLRKKAAEFAAEEKLKNFDSVHLLLALISLNSEAVSPLLKIISQKNIVSAASKRNKNYRSEDKDLEDILHESSKKPDISEFTVFLEILNRKSFAATQLLKSLGINIESLRLSVKDGKERAQASHAQPTEELAYADQPRNATNRQQERSFSNHQSFQSEPYHSQQTNFFLRTQTTHPSLSHRRREQTGTQSPLSSIINARTPSSFGHLQTSSIPRTTSYRTGQFNAVTNNDSLFADASEILSEGDENHSSHYSSQYYFSDDSQTLTTEASIESPGLASSSFGRTNHTSTHSSKRTPPPPPQHSPVGSRKPSRINGMASAASVNSEASTIEKPKFKDLTPEEREAFRRQTNSTLGQSRHSLTFADFIERALPHSSNSSELGNMLDTYDTNNKKDIDDDILAQEVQDEQKNSEMFDCDNADSTLCAQQLTEMEEISIVEEEEEEPPKPVNQESKKISRKPSLRRESTEKRIANALFKGDNPKISKEYLDNLAAESDAPRPKKKKKKTSFSNPERESHPISFHRHPQALSEEEERIANAFLLDPDRYPILSSNKVINLTYEAAIGKYDAVFGLDKEITSCIQVIGKRRTNNILLIGDPGVGKTTVVRGVAQRYVNYYREGKKARVVLEVIVSSLMEDTAVRGKYAERINQLIREVEAAKKDIVIYIDEIHILMNAGGGADGISVVNELKPALERGEFPCIGATTKKEYKQHIEIDDAFTRRFEKIELEEPDSNTCFNLLKKAKHDLEQYHSQNSDFTIKIEDNALQTAIDLSQRFIPKQRLPAKALDLIDLACSCVINRGELPYVTSATIEELIAKNANIPVERLRVSEKLLLMEDEIAKSFIGHEENVKAICDTIRNGHALKNNSYSSSTRPIGSFLFLGPTGVGKTELAKVLAEYLFYDANAITIFNMSEFSESHSKSRLLGAPPGYKDSGKGGELVNKLIEKPYQILLFDEIEKAHPDIHTLLLQMLSDGRISDSIGQTATLQDCIVILTSNLGADAFYSKNQATIGFSSAAKQDPNAIANELLDTAQKYFSPEIWARIEHKLVFKPLAENELMKIIALKLDARIRQIELEYGIIVSYDNQVIPYLLQVSGYNPKLGARSLEQTIDQRVTTSINRLIINNQIHSKDKVYIALDIKTKKLQFQATLASTETELPPPAP